MSLKSQLENELNRLAGMDPASGLKSLSVAVKDGHIESTFAAIDQLGCAFERMAFQSPKLEQATMDDLNRIAESLSKRLSYLLESISPIEIDNEGCVVQMRSSPPHQDDDGMNYYELVVRRGEISLCRYSKANRQARRLVPAQVTREVFLRLAQDLSSVT